MAGLDVLVAGDATPGGAVVVMLHGFGAPGDDLAGMSGPGGPFTLPGVRFVYPAAPLALPPEYMGGRAWWFIDMVARMQRAARGEKHDVSAIPEGLVEARAKVGDLLDTVEHELAPAPGKLVLGGFSQGAMLSLDVALRSSRAFAGLLLLSGTHIAAQEWARLLPSRAGLPVFLSHGESDEVLPFDVALALKDTLLAAGLGVEWSPFRGGHGIPPKVVGGALAFLRRVLA